MKAYLSTQTPSNLAPASSSQSNSQQQVLPSSEAPAAPDFASQVQAWMAKQKEACDPTSICPSVFSDMDSSTGTQSDMSDVSEENEMAVDAMTEPDVDVNHLVSLSDHIYMANSKPLPGPRTSRKPEEISLETERLIEDLRAENSYLKQAFEDNSDFRLQEREQQLDNMIDLLSAEAEAIARRSTKRPLQEADAQAEQGVAKKRLAYKLSTVSKQTLDSLASDLQSTDRTPCRLADALLD